MEPLVCLLINPPPYTTQLLPKEFQQMESPLAHSPFATAAIHQAYHHYLKASSTYACVCQFVCPPS